MMAAKRPPGILMKLLSLDDAGHRTQCRDNTLIGSARAISAHAARALFGCSKTTVAAGAGRRNPKYIDCLGTSTVLVHRSSWYLDCLATDIDFLERPLELPIGSFGVMRHMAGLSIVD
jgi:hypothetical protein